MNKERIIPSFYYFVALDIGLGALAVNRELATQILTEILEATNMKAVTSVLCHSALYNGCLTAAQGISESHHGLRLSKSSLLYELSSCREFDPADVRQTLKKTFPMTKAAPNRPSSCFIQSVVGASPAMLAEHGHLSGLLIKIAQAAGLAEDKSKKLLVVEYLFPPDEKWSIKGMTALLPGPGFYLAIHTWPEYESFLAEATATAGKGMALRKAMAEIFTTGNGFFQRRTEVVLTNEEKFLNLSYPLKT